MLIKIKKPSELLLYKDEKIFLVNLLCLANFGRVTKEKQSNKLLWKNFLKGHFPFSKYIFKHGFILNDVPWILIFDFLMDYFIRISHQRLIRKRVIYQTPDIPRQRLGYMHRGYSGIYGYRNPYISDSAIPMIKNTQTKTSLMLIEESKKYFKSVLMQHHSVEHRSCTNDENNFFIRYK
jgi:hypothetical protein